MNAHASTPLHRYFLTYRGVRLPLALAEEVDAEEVVHRETFFRATYDDLGQIVRCEQVVYGEVAMEHVYEYAGTGRLVRATILLPGEDPQVRSF